MYLIKLYYPLIIEISNISLIIQDVYIYLFNHYTQEKLISKNIP